MEETPKNLKRNMSFVFIVLLNIIVVVIEMFRKEAA
jgi:hypothetical protein